MILKAIIVLFISFFTDVVERIEKETTKKKKEK